MSTLTRATALCGHQDCPNWVDRNSVLDEDRDVVLFHDCDGVDHLFRDGHADGLIVARTEDGWTLTRERYIVADDETATMVPDAEPVCDVYEYGDRDYAAHHRASGRVVARHGGTVYGLLAKAARFYLRTGSGAA